MKKNISTIASALILILIVIALYIFDRVNYGTRMYRQGLKDGMDATIKRTNFLIDSTLHVKDAFYFSKKDTVSVEKNTYIESAKNVTIGQ